jgi:hypothetical protein
MTFDFLPCWPRRVGKQGILRRGCAVLAEALAHMDTAGERSCAAEAYRLKGELLLRQAIPEEVSEVLGAMGDAELESLVAAPGQACRSPSAAGGDLHG